MKRALLAASLAAAWAALMPGSARAQAQVYVSSSSAYLTPGTTGSLDVSVYVGTTPLGGYLYRLGFDSNFLSVSSIAATGMLTQFFVNGSSAPDTEPYLGLNPQSLQAPVGTAALAHIVFTVTTDTANFSGAGSTLTLVSVTPVDSVATTALPLPASGAQIDFQLVQDTIPPVATLSYVPAPTGTDFPGRPVVSTAALVVLTSTDPMNSFGYASGVMYGGYLLDASTVATQYIAPFGISPGSHTIQWFVLDRAGNVSVTQSTQVVVAPAVTTMQETAGLTVQGDYLGGVASAAARSEIAARLSNNFTLLVSSPNRQELFGVTNLGYAGVGVADPVGRLDIGAAAEALRLRSGNTVSTGTSAQIAFGYDGGLDMSHALRTEHSSGTAGNSIDFLLWTPATGSTATIAQTPVLSLQAITAASGGSMHVRPVGTADAEVEVSNGSATGGGTMQRLQWITPSSRRFKSDIRYLGAKDEDAAFEEIAGLTHVRYRYKKLGPGGRLSDDPGAPLVTGLIYEDVPESLRGENRKILVNERIAEAELALKAAIRQVEALEKRYAALKKKRRAKP